MSTADPSLEDLRERLLAARSRGQPLRLRGSGSKDFYGERLEGEVFELGSHSGILSHEPSELVLRARCGTPLSQIEARLQAAGQFLAFEPPRLGADPTLGGSIAAGLSGPRRPYVGAARDFVLGAGLLNASGECLHFGGQVMKNVAGFDVARLLCGSLGILGVITDVSLKVLPLPRCEQTLQFELSAGDAVSAFNRWAGQPLPLSGASWSAGCARVRLSGATSAVHAARARLGGELLEGGLAAQWWEALRDCRLPRFGAPSVWRVALPASSAALAIEGEPLIDWGGALRWYTGGGFEADIRAAATASRGSALCWRGPAPHGRLHPLSATTLALHRRLKERFDPDGLFNPQRLVLGL